MNRCLKNEKGFVLIWLYMLIVLMIITSGSLYAITFHEANLIRIDLARDKAFYLAEAGLDQKLEELNTSSDTSNIASGTLLDPQLAASGSYQVWYCQANDSSAQSPCTANNTLTELFSTGTYDGQTRTVRASISAAGGAPGVKAALSAVSNVLVLGGITLDGRDHDANGNLITDGSGVDTYGISTEGALSVSGNATIGGMGLAPAKPPPLGSYEEFATGNSFTTPEEVLGLVPGSLDQYKTTTPPTPPFTGITYLTGSWTQNVDFGTGTNASSGILIIHNSTGDAVIKNLSGTFTGIIIADDVIHINSSTEIIGAVVVQNQAGNTIGNGTADIKYSSTVIAGLPTSNYTISSWEDVQND